MEAIVPVLAMTTALLIGVILGSCSAQASNRTSIERLQKVCDHWKTESDRWVQTSSRWYDELKEARRDHDHAVSQVNVLQARIQVVQEALDPDPE